MGKRAAADVALIFPKNDGRRKPPAVVRDHLGLAYLAAVLRQAGARVRVINQDNTNLDSAEVAERVAGWRPLLTGLSLWQTNCGTAAELASEIRRRLPETRIIAGGHHASFAWRELLAEAPEIDGIVCGEGESTVVDLWRRLAAKAPLAMLPGTVFRGPLGPAVASAREPILDLDELPFPARDDLEAPLAEGQTRLLALSTSRGCLGHCTFCDTPAFNRLSAAPHWRARSAASVVDELEVLLRNYPPDWMAGFVHFVDDDFLGGETGKARAAEIAGELLRRKLAVKIKCLARADSVVAAVDVLPRLKQSGFENVFVGIEAADPATLKLYGKQVAASKSRLAIRLLRRLNMVDPACGAILFHPLTTFEQLQLNARFLFDLGFVDPSVLLWRLEVHPGTAMEKLLAGRGLLTPEFTHRTPYAYRFADPRVGTLADAMMSIRPGVRGASNLLFQIDRISQMLYGSPGIGGPQVEAAWKELWRGRKALGRATLRFVSASVGMAGAKWSAASFERLQQAYLEELTAQAATVESRFCAFVGACQ